ncbi:MAG: TadE/TadG family type IV pilus assembly protein [Nitrospirota bacterium]
MKTKACRILHGSAGQALVETALVLPLLVLLVIGVFELSRSIQANNIVVNMSREAANLVSRGDVSPQYAMDAVGETAQPLDMTQHGMTYITKVQGVMKDGTVQTVVVSPSDQYKWAKGNYNVASKLGTPSGTNFPVTIPDGRGGNLKLGSGEVAYVAEVFYDYQVTFGTEFPWEPTIYSMSIF